METPVTHATSRQVRNLPDAIGYLAAFLASLGLGNLSLGIVFFAKDRFDPAPVVVGWLTAVWCITYTVGCLGLRRVLTRFSPVREMVLAMLATAALTTGIRLSPVLPLVFLCYALFGFALAFFWPSLMGCLSAGREGPTLARTMARFNLSWCAGAILSPYMCGWLNERQSGAPLWMTVGLCSATALVVAAARRRDLRGPVATPAAPPAAPAAAPHDQSTPLRYPAWVGLYGSYFGQAILLAVFPLISRERGGMPESTIGLLLLMRALTNTAGFWGLGLLTAWHFRLSPMIAGQLLGAASFAILAWVRSPGLIALSLALIGLSNAVSYSASIFHGAAGSTNRARRMAIHESVLSLGIVSGAVLGGAVYGRTDYRLVYCMAAAVLAASAAVQATLRFRNDTCASGRVGTPCATEP